MLVFEGFMDFLSYLSLKENPARPLNVIVLNSVANLDKAIPFLQRHQAVHLFLDRDEAGHMATAEIASRCPQSEVIDHSGFYLGYKDVNDYLRAKKRPDEKQTETPPRRVPSVRPAPGKGGLS
ncbi:toprim domain-containing protein [Rikenella microfusus]|uniref:toprim domain-containing protein n=1 Tax=Rikenella microfusus TaxID=28139 RepID=UPI003A9047FB